MLFLKDEFWIYRTGALECVSPFLLYRDSFCKIVLLIGGFALDIIY